MIRETTGKLKNIAEKIYQYTFDLNQELSTMTQLAEKLQQDNIKPEKLGSIIRAMEENCLIHLNQHSRQYGNSTIDLIDLEKKGKTLKDQENILSQLQDFIRSLNSNFNSGKRFASYLTIALIEIIDNIRVLPKVLINIIIEYQYNPEIDFDFNSAVYLCDGFMVKLRQSFPGETALKNFNGNKLVSVPSFYTREEMENQLKELNLLLTKNKEEFKTETDKQKTYSIGKHNFLNLKTEVDKLEPLCYPTAFYFQEINREHLFNSELIHIILAYVDFAWRIFKYFMKKR